MVLVNQTQGAPAPAHEVFKLKVYAIDPNTFALEWNIKDRFFLYKQRIKVTADLKANFDLGKLKMPASLEHKNAQERIDAIYRNKLIMPVSVLGIQAGEGLIELKYQGCADDGFCYPPQNQLLKYLKKQLIL